MWRAVETTVWTDPKIKAFDGPTKLIYLYLWTCPHGNLAGIYYLPLEVIALEVGLELDTVRKGIDTLSEGYLVKYDPITCTIWVVEFYSKQPGGSKRAAHVKAQLVTLHNSVLIKEFQAYYEKAKIPNRHPTDTVSDGYPAKEREKERDKETKKEKDNDEDEKREKKKIEDEPKLAVDTPASPPSVPATPVARVVDPSGMVPPANAAIARDVRRADVAKTLSTNLRIRLGGPDQNQQLSDLHYVQGLLQCIEQVCSQSGGSVSAEWDRCVALSSRIPPDVKKPVAWFRSQAKKIWGDPGNNGHGIEATTKTRPETTTCPPQGSGRREGARR
jgi:hypothetical protein